MGKKDKKKGAGLAKTAAKTEKKANQKLKKELAARGEVDLDSLLGCGLNEDVGASEVVTEEDVTSPNKRSAFTLLPHPDKDQLILFGGEYFNGSKTTMFNDMFLYNLKNNRWTRLSSPSSPPPRAGHQAVAVSQGGGQVWVFGGEFTSESQSQFHHFKDLWVFHLAEKRWQKVIAAGGPSPRSGHRMVWSKRHLLVFGGFRDNGRTYTYLNDAYTFSLDDYKWTTLKPTGTAPSPRSACQMAALPDGRVVVSGGYSRHSVRKDVDQGVTHTDMFTLFQEKETWRWKSVKQGGAVPSTRSGLSLSQPALGEKVYLFGGVFDRTDEDEELEGEFYNDLFQLDLNKHIWHTVNLMGKKESGEKKRRRKKKEDGEEDEMEDQLERMTVEEEAEVVSQDDIFTVTVGPAPKASSSSQSRSSKSEAAFVPSPRINPGMAVKKGVLYLYGGMYEDGDRQFTLRDFYSLDLGKLDEWKVIIPPEDEAAMEWIESDSESSDDDDDDDDDSDDSDDDDDDEEGMDID